MAMYLGCDLGKVERRRADKQRLGASKPRRLTPTLSSKASREDPTYYASGGER